MAHDELVYCPHCGLVYAAKVTKVCGFIVRGCGCGNLVPFEKTDSEWFEETKRDLEGNLPNPRREE